MRIVRFYFEPWQKGGSPSPSPSILILSPRIKRRQRIPKCADTTIASNKGETDKQKILRQKLRSRSIQPVKRLTSICSDVLAKNVRNVHLKLNFHFLTSTTDFNVI